MAVWARRIGRALAWTAAGLGGVAALYVLAALLLGLVPANRDWREPEAGVVVYVRTNGVHTWVMMPTVTAAMDWRQYAPPHHLRDPLYAGDHVAIGYGHRDFYLETREWADLRPGPALRAALGIGSALMHVEYDHRPAPADYQRPIRLTADQYRRLVAFVAAGFARGPDGETLPLLGRGYADWDMFYESDGRYDLFLTCNEWTGRALRAAGVRTGLWTPLEQSIMWRLD